MSGGAPGIPAALRPALVLDAPVLAALHAPCFPEEPWPAAAMATLLESPGVFGLIAHAHAHMDVHGGDRAVARGFILCRLVADEGEVLTLAVPPAGRRRGTGGRLLAGALAWARACGVATLFLEVAEDNPAARALYQAAGFLAVGRRPDYYRRGFATVAALVLARSLADDG